VTSTATAPAAAAAAPGRRPVLAPVLAVASGLAIAASMPPWGWWPLALVGLAGVDRLLAGQPGRRRFGRMWLVAAAWLYPAMLWMADLTLPGYLVAGAFYAAYFGVAAVVTPPGGGRRLVLPGAIALAELARWSFPFGGVPLAHLALSQADTPWAVVVRVGGPLLLVVLVVVAGQALSAAVERRWPVVAAAGAVVALAVAAASVHPRASVVGAIDAAVVQGGGPQGTRASPDQQPVTLARTVEATGLVDRPVELIVWPENVVNPGTFLDHATAARTVRDVAAEHRAVVLPGWFYRVFDDQDRLLGGVNFTSAVTPEGDEVDRYDKVRIVPFGEFVPFRPLIELFTDEVPASDVIPGTDPPVLDTPVGRVGVAISWEAFFEHRTRHAVREGAELLTNPTNGSSYWLTQVQTQQVASNQLRALEADRWLLQASPTGFSGVYSPDGEVVARTAVSERAAVAATVELRQGRTLASVVGPWPVVLYGLAAVAASLVAARRAVAWSEGTPARDH
jgi:apolipoprotein N-acyltransferase